MKHKTRSGSTRPEVNSKYLNIALASFCLGTDIPAAQAPADHEFLGYILLMPSHYTRIYTSAQRRVA